MPDVVNASRTFEDPLVSAWFMVEFAKKIEGAFREVSGLGSESEVVEYKGAGDKGQLVMKKIPGRMKWSEITLKRGITSSMDAWKWRQEVEEGKIAQARVAGSIHMYSQEGKIVATWNFKDAWPSKITGPMPNAGSNEIGLEEIVIHHEGYIRVL